MNYTHAEKRDFIIKNYPVSGGRFCADELGIAMSNVHNITFKYQIKLKPRIDKEIFLTITKPEVAYFLGMVWADGNISKSNTISLTIVEKDFEEIYYILSEIGNARIHRHSHANKNWSPQVTLYFTVREIKKMLSEFDYSEKGIKSPIKILKHIPSNLHKYFFMGWIDGDGCYYINEKRGLYQFHITSTYDQDWSSVENLFKNLNIGRYKVIRKKNLERASSLIRLTSKMEIKKLGEYLYSDSKFRGLPRKFAKYYLIESKCYKWK